MKKMMFNDSLNLTNLVIDKNKTMTRRVIVLPKEYKGIDLRNFTIEYWDNDSKNTWFVNQNNGHEIETNKPYNINEVIAVSQCYLNIGNPRFDDNGHDIAANTNKMFVKAELMPHQVKIIDIFPQRLQDISDEDCLKEGIYRESCFDDYNGCFDDTYYYTYYDSNDEAPSFNTPRDAYASLIDRVSSKGTWDRNDWQWVISLELVK